MTPLSIEDAREAYRIGLKRHRDHDNKGTANNFGERSEDNKHQDGMAALAEATVAAFLEMDWVRDAGGADDGADVGGVVGVRWTNLPNGGLILKTTDRDYVPHVLVVGWTFPLRMVGWAIPQAARLPSRWREDIPKPAYIVPQSCLRSMDSLEAHLRSTT